MTTTSNSTTTAGRTRTAGSGLVLAGDRTVSRKKAGRHSNLVRTLKYALPAAAVATIAMYSVAVLKVTGWGAGIPQLKLPQIIPDNISMENPHYEGFNKDGGQYWVKAKTGQQDLKNLANFNLIEITGDLVDAQKSKTHLTATRGTFNNKTNVLELFEAIDVAGDNGLKAQLTRATVNTKENVITSNEPVVVTMEAGTINANQMTVHQKTKAYTFADKVRTYINGKPQAQDAPAAGAKKPAASFGNSNEPIDIVSQRLDVDDLKKTAVFTGSVKAVQGSSSLSSPEMTVIYEGTAASTAGAAAAAQGGGKVKHVTAANSVVLTQADGQTVTSRSADFDTINQKAVLEGEVVMSQLPDKRATGDRAEVDEAANTMLLTGTVVVTQGQNILKGRRLLYNRAANKMQMTAPGGGAGGRVITHFQQDGAAAAAKAANPAKADATQGIAFGGSFKTDAKAPVDVEADRLDIDDAKKEAVFVGGVHAVQGDFVIRSAELVATYAGSAGLGAEAAGQQKSEAAHLTRLQAKKNVVVTSKDGQSATGDWADFDTRANTVTLGATAGGNVVLNQGKNVIRGTKLVIDMTTGESIIRTEAATAGGTPAVSQTDGTGGSAIVTRSNRPSAVFYPNQLKDAAGAGADKAAKKAAPGAWTTQPAASKTP